jgi:hypothetical protein
LSLSFSSLFTPLAEPEIAPPARLKQLGFATAYVFTIRTESLFFLLTIPKDKEAIFHLFNRSKIVPLFDQKLLKLPSYYCPVLALRLLDTDGRRFAHLRHR